MKIYSQGNELRISGCRRLNKISKNHACIGYYENLCKTCFFNLFHVEIGIGERDIIGSLPDGTFLLLVEE